MQFETKFFLIFGAIALVVLFMGSGSLSLQEAKSKADKNISSLNTDQLNKLVVTQRNFTEAAFPVCSKTTGMLPGKFTIVIEVDSDGYVGRSWRKGYSDFVLCIQKVMKDNFIFRPYSQPFFISFEYTEPL